VSQQAYRSANKQQVT